jgi:hypothetical protein
MTEGENNRHTKGGGVGSTLYGSGYDHLSLATKSHYREHDFRGANRMTKDLNKSQKDYSNSNSQSQS